MGKSQQQRPLVEACHAATVTPAISFHTLRHTYASLMVMDGVPLIVVARNLGHSDTRMVEKHYGHLTSSYIRGHSLGPGDWDWRQRTSCRSPSSDRRGQCRFREQRCRPGCASPPMETIPPR